MLRSRQASAAWLHRLIAAAGVMLVLLLAGTAVRPDVHELVHHDGHEESHTCAVVLFAAGIVAGSSLFLVEKVFYWRDQGRRAAGAEIAVCTPRQLLPPVCGPPVSLVGS